MIVDIKDLTTQLKVDGPLYTKEDCTDHDCVAAIITCRNALLVFDHIKMDRVAVPVGKVKSGQKIEDALKEEMKEELGIDLLDWEEVITFVRPYIINDVPVRIVYHIFHIIKFGGIIRNLEPHKHKNLRFISIKEAKKIMNLSTAAISAIRYLDARR